jgi:hypothetical protein
VFSLVHKKSRATSLQGCYAEIVLVIMMVLLCCSLRISQSLSVYLSLAPCGVLPIC